MEFIIFKMKNYQLKKCDECEFKIIPDKFKK